MKLHSIELENWRKHERKEINFDETATVIFGPNETGKSTILEALSMGLFDRHDSGAQEIRKIMPISAIGGVPSTVRIKFSVGGDTYFVVKTFNYNTGTKLYQIRDGSQTLIAQDKTADRRIIDLLEAELQSRRASDPSKWGAFYWLWTLQDKRELPKEGDPTRALHLEKAEGKILVTPKFLNVKESFEWVYSEYYTAKGKDRSRSPLLEVKNELDELDLEKRRLNLRISTVEQYKQDLEEKLKSLPNLEEALEKSRNELKKAIEESQDFVKIEAELDVSRSKINELKIKVSEAENALCQLKGAAKKIEDLRFTESTVRNALTEVEVKYQGFESKINDFNKKIEKKSSKLSKIDELLSDARILYTKKGNQAKIKDLENKIKHIVDLEEKIKELRSHEVKLFISEEELLDLEKSFVTLNIYRDRLLESGLFIERRAGVKDNLSVIVDGVILEDSDTSATGVEEVKVYYEELGEVSIRANLQKAQDIKSDIEIIEKKIANSLENNNVSSIKELRQIYNENNRITIEIQSLSAERKGIDERSKDILSIELDSLNENAKRYEDYERSEFVIDNNPTDVDLGVLVNQREEQREQASDALESLRESRDEVRDEYDQKREERAKISAQHESITEQISEALTAQQDLIRRFGSEEIQAGILEEEQGKLREEVEKESEIQIRYKEYEEGPLATIKRLETTIENQEKLLQIHRASVEQLRGQIIESSFDGAYSQLSRVESRMETLSERFENETVKAESIMLLKQVIEEKYQSTLKSVTEPIKNDVETYIAYVTGNLHEEIELNDNLFPVKLGERGFEELALDYDDASSGLREILGLCVRLAVAKHLCTEEPQCLVLDDPFVHVSSNRSGKMIELINKVVEDTGLQVIILTHRPVEFAGFSGSLVNIEA